MFKYIITIHNSQDHLREVLNGVKSVKTAFSKVYCVLDGCTDDSEAICDEFPTFKKILTSNVRETKAITLALGQISQNEGDFNVILQDDVVLTDKQFEDKIIKAYEWNPKIGVLGMRHGCNFKDDALVSGEHSSEQDLIQNECQPEIPKVPQIEEGYITERQVVYKSPICISGEVVKKLGGYDQRFEPIAHDDTEYCIRAIKEGYKNYVLGIQLLQPPAWGGTRRFTKTHEDNLHYHKEHMNLIRKLYTKEISDLSKNKPSPETCKIF